MSAPNGPGIQLARALFEQVIRPILASAHPDLRYDAGLIGAGSEVLGFDTERSRDHDFGPRCQIFMAQHDPRYDEVTGQLASEMPSEFGGYPTRFTRGVEPPDRENPPSQVVVTSVPEWSIGAFEVDVTGPLTPVDWLGFPWQVLASTTGGAVFHAGLGELPAMRARLAYYPDDIWRFVLAGQWLRIAQEEPFVGRTGEVGDDLGSAILAGRLVRDLMHLALLLRRRYPPYAKWLGSAFARLSEATTLGPMLAGALRAADWQVREKHLCQGYAHLAALQNDIGIAATVDPTCRPFFDRPFQVLDARRFADALLDAITDPAIRQLPLIGSVDQVADSTDVLSHTGRARAVTRELYC